MSKPVVEPSPQYRHDTDLMSRSRDGAKPPTVSAALATSVLEGVGHYLWGLKPDLMAHFVAQRGPFGALFWFVRHMPRYERILKRFGPLRTHLLSSVISTMNGCNYCTFGHAHAFQLHYLKSFDSLFPLDEDAIFALRGADDESVLEAFSQACKLGGLQYEVPYLHRLQALRQPGYDRTSSLKSGEDSDIRHLIKMFAALNACGIRAAVEPDAAHDPINRDGELKQRYRWLRRNDGKSPVLAS